MNRPGFVVCLMLTLAVTLCGSNYAWGLGFKTHTYRAGIGPGSVAKGDFNNDGKVDLVIADGCQNINCDTYGVVKVLFGNGDGTFTSGKKYRSAQDGESSLFVAAGDFNGDGNLDVAVVNNGINIFGDVSVLLGNGDGSFGPPTSNEVGGSTPVWVATGDFNRDGKLDLAVSVTTTNSVAILLGRGDGTFKTAVNYPVEDSPQGFTVADVNHDHKLDLIVANECGHTPGCRDGTVSILLGNGDGTFQPQLSFFVGIFPLAVAVADFNKDGQRDIVATLPCGTDQTCAGNGGVGILLGNGDGTFQTVTPYIGTGLDTARLAAGDFNGDHFPDVVALNYVTSNITILTGNGDGTLQSGVTFPVGASPISVKVGKFNHDKAVDLAVVNEFSNSVTILINTGP